jgi:thymidylate kinase
MTQPIKHPFISIEGVDGAGKTTLLQKLVLRIQEETGLPVTVFKTPPPELAEARIGVELRANPLERREFYLNGLAIMQQRIEDAREDGIVICDRHIHSTVSYQYDKVPTDLKSIVPDLILPDITFLVTVSEATRRQRLKQREEESGIVNPNDHQDERIIKADANLRAMAELNMLHEIASDDLNPDQVCEVAMSLLRHIGAKPEAATDITPAL